MTIFIGAIDFCTEICLNNDQEFVIETAARNLHRAITIIQKNLPRTMVNVVLPPDVSVINRLTDKPGECQTFNYFECPCFFSASHEKNLKRSMSTVQRLISRCFDLFCAL